MSYVMQRLRSFLPNKQGTSSNATAQRHSVTLEPEVGFQISIEACTFSNGDSSAAGISQQQTVPELNVHLIAARHLPALFGFKIVHGYLIKVKLFPGSKRLDSSIQTNSWPKFNENFRFPLAPDIKSSLKHSSTARRSSKVTNCEFTPEELFAGQFVVFTVYALLELPPASFNRFNKTYRSLRDKSSNLVQKVVESSSGKTKDEKENATNGIEKTKKQKSNEPNPRDPIPPLTISEARRNIGSVTCYLEPKLFKRNARTGVYTTEELWLPIKDITTTVVKTNNNNLGNATKGVVELALEIKNKSLEAEESPDNNETKTSNGFGNNNSTNNQNKNSDNPQQGQEQQNTPTTSATSSIAVTPTTPTPATNGIKNPQFTRMTSEVKRKIGMNNNAKAQQHDMVLRVTTARMRCSNKAKDELESTAGSVYVKTTVFEHGIYIDSWKSPNFYPSLSTKWDVNEAATLDVPLQSLQSLDNILIRTTLATKTKLGKKLVLGTVLVGASVNGGNGAEHMQLLRETLPNERVSMWHSYQ